MRTHTKTFHIRLTEKEYDRLCTHAKKAGLPKTTYIRHMINGCSVKEQAPAVFRKYVNEANKVTTSFINILHFARHTGCIDIETVNEQIEEHKRIYMAIFNAVIGPEKVNIPETVERGRMVAEADQIDIEESKSLSSE